MRVLVVIATSMPWTAVFVGSATLLGVLEIFGLGTAVEVLWRTVRIPSAPSERRG